MLLDIFQAPCVGGVSVASGDIFGGQGEMLYACSASISRINAS